MRISDWSSDVCSSDLANALARSGRRFEQYMLHLAHHKEAVADAAEHNALFRAKARLADFAFARGAGFTVEVPFRPQDDRHKQHRPNGSGLWWEKVCKYV